MGSINTPAAAQFATGNSGYPQLATPIAAAATGTTAAVAATLTANAAKYNYIAGFSATPGSATTAIVNTVTVTGLESGQTFTYTTASPVTAAGVTGTPLVVYFNPPIASNGFNTAITVTQSALGAGGINAAVNVWGYQT